MEFIKPNLLKKQKGVYQLIFDDKWFYIGSSIDLKSRLRTWHYNITSRTLKKHLNIKNILPFTSVVRFEVIFTCVSEKESRDKETNLLKECWGNPLLLNRCPDANTPIGMRPYIGYIKPDTSYKRKGIPDWMKPKRVAVFSKDNNFIEIVNSYTELERKYKIRGSKAKMIFDGKRGQPRKVTIKSIGLNGMIIEPKIYIKPKQINFHQPNKKKPVNQIDSNGNIVATYSFYKEAAIAAGCSGTYMHNCLKMKFRGQTKEYKAGGYIWKYA